MQEKKQGRSANYKQGYNVSKLLKLWVLLGWGRLLK